VRPSSGRRRAAGHGRHSGWGTTKLAAGLGPEVAHGPGRDEAQGGGAQSREALAPGCGEAHGGGVRAKRRSCRGSGWRRADQGATRGRWKAHKEYVFLTTPLLHSPVKHT
jgi:hypothetical protein